MELVITALEKFQMFKFQMSQPPLVHGHLPSALIQYILRFLFTVAELNKKIFVVDASLAAWESKKSVNKTVQQTMGDKVLTVKMSQTDHQLHSVGTDSRYRHYISGSC